MNRITNSCTLKIRGGVDRDVYGKKAGKGALIQWEKSATLGANQDQTLFVFGESAPIVYGIEPGAAQRLDPTKRIWLEKAPTLRANAGDNQASVIICKSDSDEIHKL